MLNTHDSYGHAACGQSDAKAAQGRSISSRIRRGLLVAIGSGCLVLGLVLVVTVIRPETLGTLSTAELAAIVGLITLPALTMLSLKFDRSVVKALRHANCRQSVLESQSLPARSHSAHTRGFRTVRHARLSDSTEPISGATSANGHEKTRSSPSSAA
jgi:hypothetical protein